MTRMTNRWAAGAIALTIGVGLTACDRSPRQPERDAGAGLLGEPGGQRSDGSITTSVQARYYADDAVRGRNIDVTTEQGVVTLRGTVEDDLARQRALTLAQEVDGVTRVEDQLKVDPRETAAAAPDASPAAREDQQTTGTAGGAERIDAAWITTRINAQYFVNRDVSPWSVDVSTTSGGVVTLRGEVETPQQKAEAVRLARETDGVTRVEDNLRVKGEPRRADQGPAVEDGPDQPDSWVTAKVQAKYFLDDQVKGREIDVDTTNGVVTLSGTVGSEAEKRQAVALARSTDGVRNVNDTLQVRTDADGAAVGHGAESMTTVRTLDEAAADMRITTTIQSKYFLDDQVKGREIDVDTRKGVVTLKGRVSEQALKQQAERIASETSGVSRVVNQITVAAN